MDVLQSMRDGEDDEVREQFEAAVKCLKRSFMLYRMEELALSFNAGKDSCALLHVLRAALADAGIRCKNGYTCPGRDAQECEFVRPAAASTGSLCGMKCFMFAQQDEFAEIHAFSKEMDLKYGLSLEYLACPMPLNLKSFAERHGIKAVVLGTRRGDPNAPGQSHFSPTTGDWPPLMRINPILDWSYQNVWGFLRRISVPYCKLYDAGYTSIGGIHNTRPNSSLRKENGTYAPAYLLADNRLERIGRRPSGTHGLMDCSALIRKAALLIVGDELLSGKVEDVNVVFLCRELRSLGWRVNKIVFVGDDVDSIADEVHALSTTHEMVLTAGGVGPTIDDVTMQGVAAAMQTSLARHPYLVQLMRDFFKENVTEAHLKMTEVPQEEVEFVETFTTDGRPSPFPLVKCRNVYMFPGVPDYLRLRWKALKQKLSEEESLPPFHNIVLRLKLTDETEIASALDTVTCEMGPELQIGSYPAGPCLNDLPKLNVPNRESEFKQRVKQLLHKDKKQEEEIKQLRSLSDTLQQSNLHFQSHLHVVQDQLNNAIEEIRTLPSDIVHQISKLDGASLDSPSLKEMLLWMDNSVQRALVLLQRTVEMTWPSSVPDADVLHQLKRKDRENQSLKHQIHEHEAHIENLHRRESELGANYNALLNEYEHLCQYFTDSEDSAEQETDTDVASELTPGKLSNSELSSVILSMDTLRSQLDKGFPPSPRNSLHYSTKQSRDSQPREGPKERIRKQMNKLLTRTRHVNCVMQNNAVDMDFCLSHAMRDHQAINSSLQHLNARLSSMPAANDMLFEEDSRSSLSALIRQSIETERKQVTAGSHSAEEQLAFITDRLMHMNRKVFEHFALYHADSTEHLREIIAHLNLETQQIRKAETHSCRFLDDCALRSQRWRYWSPPKDLERQIAEHAQALKCSKSRQHQLRDTAEFQQFVISQQQSLLSINEQEIQEMLDQQRSMTQHISELSIQVEERNKELEHVRTETNNFVEKKDKTEMQIQTLCQELSQLDNERSILEREEQEIEEKMHQLLQQQQEAHARLTMTRKRMEFRKQGISQQNQDLFSLKKEQQIADDELTKLQQELDDRLAETNRLEKHKAQLSAEVEARNDALRRVVEQGREQMKEIQDLEMQQSDLEKTLDSLQEERATLDKVRSKKHEEIQRLHYKTEIQQQENQASSSASPHSETPMQPCPHTAGAKDALRKDQTDPQYQHVETCASGTMADIRSSFAQASQTSSKDVKFACASQSGDLLIQCLEMELKKEQERNRKQAQIIQQLSDDLESARQTCPAPSLHPVE